MGLAVAAAKYTCDRIHIGAIKHMVKVYVTWPCGNNPFLYDNSLHAHLSTDLGLLVDKFHVLRVWDPAHSMRIMQKEKWEEEMNEWITAAPRSCLWDS